MDITKETIADLIQTPAGLGMIIEALEEDRRTWTRVYPDPVTGGVQTEELDATEVYTYVPEVLLLDVGRHVKKGLAVVFRSA